MRIGQIYFHTSIVISRQDMQDPVTLHLKFPISKNSVFKDQEFVFKIWQKSSKQKIAGLHSAPPPYGAAPLPPTHVGTKFLAAVVLDNQDRALHLSHFSQKFSQLNCSPKNEHFARKEPQCLFYPTKYGASGSYLYYHPE